MRSVFMFACVALLAIVGLAQPALAIPAFSDVFKKEFLDNHPDKKFAEEVNGKDENGKVLKCLVCHQGFKIKKARNAYGDQLDLLLDRKTDAKDVEKVVAAIKKVNEMHVDPKDDKSETFGDRLKAGKWPAGDLEALKKEPAKSDDKAAEK